MAFDPFEEKLNEPATFVNLRDLLGGVFTKGGHDTIGVLLLIRVFHEPELERLFGLWIRDFHDRIFEHVRTHRDGKFLHDAQFGIGFHSCDE